MDEAIFSPREVTVVKAEQLSLYVNTERGGFHLLLRANLAGCIEESQTFSFGEEDKALTAAVEQMVSCRISELRLVDHGRHILKTADECRLPLKQVRLLSPRKIPSV